MGKEIERKFLFKQLIHDLPKIEEAYVSQGYISFDPEIRIRRVRKNLSVSHLLTIKGDGDISRSEINLVITKEQFDELAKLIDFRLVVKYYISYKLPTGEILEFSNVDNGNLLYLEVEFPSLLAAGQFQVPDYFGREITYEDEYKMKNYYRARFKL